MTRAPATADRQRIGRGHEPSSRHEPTVGDAWNVPAFSATASRDDAVATSGDTMPVRRIGQRHALDMMCD